MKKIKRLVCMLLSLVLIAACTTSAFAIGGIQFDGELKAANFSFDTIYSPQNGVIGDDEAIAITDKSIVSTYPYNAIVRLLAYHDACGCKSQGTGFLISPKCIATCGHVLIPCDCNNPCTRVEIDMMCYQSNGTAHSSVKMFSYNFDYDERYITADDYDKINYDYGYILLDTDSANIVSSLIPKYFELGILMAQPPYNIPIYITGYRKAILYEGSATITNLVGNRFYHEVDTKKGQSGSPMYLILGGTAYVYGINTSGHNKFFYPNSGRRIDEQLVAYFDMVK